MDETLRQAVARVWAVFGDARVSGGLEVCHCPVCMTEETRREITRTLPSEMPAALIRGYSNSAHGVPHWTDDLKALLPRYLELLSAGEMVDHNGVGTELLRFGDAWRAEPGLFSDAERAALDGWMRAFVSRATFEDEDLYEGIPAHVLDLVLCGPFAAGPVLEAFDAVLDGPGGAAIMADMARGIVGRRGGLEDGLFGIGYAGSETREALAEWLNGTRTMERLVEAAEVVAERDAWTVWTLFDLSGTIRGNMFADHRKREAERA